MKNYNKILEAVNKGIKFALDDFEDNEQIQGQVNSKVKYKDGTKEYLNSMNKVIDLGLPSGTLWYKYNLGASQEYEGGNYYAWGELFEYVYDAKTYIYKDNPIQLPPEHDIATQTLGKYYSIPTKEQCKELLKYTKKGWVKNYKGSGVNGRLFISKINGNSIFIPAVGFGQDYDNYEYGSNGGIWTSSLDIDNTNYAFGVYFGRSHMGVYEFNRHQGWSVRPVFGVNKIKSI